MFPKLLREETENYRKTLIADVSDGAQMVTDELRKGASLIVTTQLHVVPL